MLRKTHLNVSKIIIFAESSLESLSPLGKKADEIYKHKFAFLVT